MVAISRFAVVVGAFAFAGGLKQEPEPRALGVAARKEALHSAELSLENRMAAKKIQAQARAHSKAEDSARAAAKATEKEREYEKKRRSQEQAAQGFALNREKQQFEDRIKAAAKIAVDNAENNVLFPGEDHRMEAFAIATGISTKQHLKEISQELTALLPNSSFVADISKKQRESISDWVVSSRRAFQLFAQKNVDATDTVVLANVAEVLQAWSLGFSRHQHETAEFRKMFVDQLPSPFMKRFGPMVTLMTPSVKVKFSSKDFYNTTLPDACGRILGLVKDLAPEYGKISEAQALLSASAAMVPHLKSVSPKPQEQAVAFVKDLVKIGYVEALGAQTASQDLISSVGPVLASRLHCLTSASAAEPVRGLGLLALVAGLYFTLSQIL